MLIDRLEVTYCEGWDPGARMAIGPLAAARAAERDHAGEQYAVLLSVSGQPLAIVEVAWRALSCGVWFFDEQRRRALMADCRRLTEDRLFVRGGRQWAYSGPADPEFDDDVTHGEYEIQTDGARGGGATYQGNKNPIRLVMAQPPDAWLDVPVFGEWGRLIQAFPEHLAVLGHELSPGVQLEDVADPGGTGLPPAQWPWQPPRPLQPTHLDLLFRPGTRLEVGTSEAIAGVGGTVAVEVPQLGTLRLPSGALVACDPTYLRPVEPDASEWATTKSYTYQQTRHPFTATVPPGDYPVVLSRFRWLRGSGPTVAAVKVWVGDGPVDSWEMALRAGEDPRTLPDGGFFGFGVDAGTGCFFDATAASALASRTREFALGYEESSELTDDASGANLIAFHSGWGDGSYPVWIGRTAVGDINCFVADLLTFDIMTPIAR